MQQLIGRIEEQKSLKSLLQSPEAELVAITGRRRVGKTFLVTQCYQPQIVFDLVGIQDGALNVQLQNFADQFSAYSQSEHPISTPQSWAEAFKILRNFLQKRLSPTEKKVVFFDELPWLATQKSSFLQAFGYFWNSWASRQNLIIVICGSSASWMIQRVVNDTGGLHNRITKRLHLEPFTLSETEAYLKTRHHSFSRYQITELYMAMGGIPHYLKELNSAYSIVQNIDRICFAKQGLLSDEFNRLYFSLFTHAERHIQVVRTLASKKQGMTRSELAQQAKLEANGGLTKVLNDLIQSGFVAEYYPFDKKKKEKIYRVCDEYSLFYLQFVEQNRFQGGNIWQHLSQTAGYKTWTGYAFENICLKHIERIKQAMSIAGIYSRAASFYKKSTNTEQGLQIDLVLERNDQTINLFEVKFYNQVFTLSKEYADHLRQVMGRFQTLTATKKHVAWVLISTFGLAENMHSRGLVSQTLTLDDLF